MDMPHGVLAKSYQGPQQLQELNASLAKDGFTGFIRASINDGGITEGVLVYASGKPIISFVSDGRTDHPDNEQQTLAAIMSKDALIEQITLSEIQLKLVKDFCKEFTIKQAPPPAPEIPKPAPMPVAKPKSYWASNQERPRSMPEVRGKFLKSRAFDNLTAYLSTLEDETGHAIVTIKEKGKFIEYHLLLLKGGVEAAYSESYQSAGIQLIELLSSKSCGIEFYQVDESTIHSILARYPWITISGQSPEAQAANEPRQTEAVRQMPAKTRPETVSPPPAFPSNAQAMPARPEAAPHGAVTRPPESAYLPQSATDPSSVINLTQLADQMRSIDIKPETKKPLETISRQGISTKSLLEKNNRQAYSVEGDLGMPVPEAKSTGTLKGDIEDDADFVKKIESDFVGNVDDILKRLELTHLRVVPEKKKR